MAAPLVSRVLAKRNELNQGGETQVQFIDKEKQARDHFEALEMEASVPMG
jgi:hypothetical protein